MAQNADNIQFAAPKTEGCAWSAVSGTAVPTDASTALADAFTSLGYLNENGLSQSISKTVSKIKEMGGEVAKSIQTEHSVSYTLTPMEMNQAVFTEWVGADNVTVSDGKYDIDLSGDDTPERAYVFEMCGLDGKLIRITCPRGKVTSLGEISYKAGTVIASQLTIEAMPDSTGSKGHIYYE